MPVTTRSLTLLAFFALLFSACQQQRGSVFQLYKDPAQPIERRVENLLAQMTVEEKVAQLLCRWNSTRRMMDSTGRFLPDSAALLMPHGIGQIARPKEGYAGNGNFPGRTAAETVLYTNDIQRWLVEKTRLGIPAVMHEESLHGYVARDATSFPQAIGLASTWNPVLIERCFDVAGREARACGNHLVLAPVVDIVREPRWGRTEETYGEDAWLAGEIGLAAVYGFQGRGEKIDGDHVMATLKHMTGHGQPEGGSNIAPAPATKRVILEQFLPPFKKCIEQGRARNVMASYNEIDGVPSHNSTWLLQDILRNEWGFDGCVVSDYDAIPQLADRHHVAANHAEAAAKALLAGVDVETPDPTTYRYLTEMVRRGEVPMAALDKAVARVLYQKFELGLFENPYADEAKATRTVGTPESANLARQAAEEAIVLLQNEGNLAPVDLSRYRNIAVIGPNADKTLLGGYSDQPRHFITVLQGIRQYVGDRATVTYAEGCGITNPCSWYKDSVSLTDRADDRRKLREAVETARSADLIVLAIGSNECESREGWADNHLGDNPSMNLPGLQDSLVDALHRLGKPMVALLLNGRPYSICNVKDKVPAIFECWYPGQEAGHAIANVLFGKVSPSGKLPITFPRSAGHLPVFYNHKPTARRSYIFDDVSPLFCFGYGLTYSTFEVGAPVLSDSVIGPNQTVQVSVRIKNTGTVAAREVVQCYVRDQISSVTRPVKELRDFVKTDLKPGEEKTLTFNLTPDKLAFYDEKMNWTVEPGAFTIMTGTSSRDVDLKTTVLRVR